jgi:hypothetical protein
VPPVKATTPGSKKFEEKRAAGAEFRDIFDQRLVVKADGRVYRASVVAQSLE